MTLDELDETLSSTEGETNEEHLARKAIERESNKEDEDWCSTEEEDFKEHFDQEL